MIIINNCKKPVYVLLYTPVVRYLVSQRKNSTENDIATDERYHPDEPYEYVILPDNKIYLDIYIHRDFQDGMKYLSNIKDKFEYDTNIDKAMTFKSIKDAYNILKNHKENKNATIEIDQHHLDIILPLTKSKSSPILRFFPHNIHSDLSKTLEKIHQEPFWIPQPQKTIKQVQESARKLYQNDQNIQL